MGSFGGLSLSAVGLQRASRAALTLGSELAASLPTASLRLPHHNRRQLQTLAMLTGHWQNYGKGDRMPLVGAYRIQSRGLLQSFVGTRQAMLARLGGEEFTDGTDRKA